MVRRGYRPGDSRHYFDWLEFASQDLLAAKVLSEDGQCLQSAAFHCQQAIEKALKAYILFKTDAAVDGHNLTWLCRQAVKQDKSFGQWLDESAALNRYYIETRYPSDREALVNEKKIEKLSQMATDMLEFICDAVYDEMEDLSEQ